MPDYRRNRVPGGTYFFTVAPPKTEHLFAAPSARGERGIWRRRFCEHTIRDEIDYAAHVDYVHINPVKHGLVTCVRDLPQSSFHRCVAQGIYSPNWAGQGVRDVPAGERRA